MIEGEGLVSRRAPGARFNLPLSARRRDADRPDDNRAVAPLTCAKGELTPGRRPAKGRCCLGVSSSNVAPLPRLVICALLGRVTSRSGSAGVAGGRGRQDGAGRLPHPHSLPCSRESRPQETQKAMPDSHQIPARSTAGPAQEDGRHEDDRRRRLTGTCPEGNRYFPPDHDSAWGCSSGRL